MTKLDRALRRVLGGRAGWRVTAAAVAAGGAGYGAVMGSFGGVTGERLLQVMYSAVKVPLLLAVTTGLVLPSFFVLNTLAGLRSDLPAAVGAVLRAQGVVALALVSLAPLVGVWYVSGASYPAATAFNGGMFCAASLAGQWRLGRRYRPLVARDRRHRLTLAAWLAVYVFVGIQMGYVLRPFVGDPERRPTFFRPGAWGNAYVVVAETLAGAVGR